MLMPDPWQALRNATPARIALGRAGGSLPTRALLDFNLAHSQARDAVLADFDAVGLAGRMARWRCEVLTVATLAGDRPAFLRRPDWGRRLAPHDAERLDILRGLDPCREPAYDLVIIVSAGLSAWAAERHVEPLLDLLIPALQEAGWRLAPLIVAPFARVALQDEVGERLGARLALTLLGERPGLTAPDSLGAYFVHEPRVGNTDAQRNCVSNIRPAGLSTDQAAAALLRLLHAASTRGISGVGLKDDRLALKQSVGRAEQGLVQTSPAERSIAEPNRSEAGYAEPAAGDSAGASGIPPHSSTE